jgi:hypothetical protein
MKNWTLKPFLGVGKFAFGTRVRVAQPSFAVVCV